MLMIAIPTSTSRPAVESPPHLCLRVGAMVRSNAVCLLSSQLSPEKIKRNRVPHHCAAGYCCVQPMVTMLQRVAKISMEPQLPAITADSLTPGSCLTNANLEHQ